MIMRLAISARQDSGLYRDPGSRSGTSEEVSQVTLADVEVGNGGGELDDDRRSALAALGAPDRVRHRDLPYGPFYCSCLAAGSRFPCEWNSRESGDRLLSLTQRGRAVAEAVILVCDQCGKPAEASVTIRVGARGFVKDLCEEHLRELLSNTRTPRRGRPKTTAPTRSAAAPAGRGRRRSNNTSAVSRRTGRPRKRNKAVAT
jgi:hypothetical protein